MHYAAMDENAFAYKTEGHRHRPEIEQELAALGSPAPVVFVPHLLPLDQGELATCYAQTTEPISREAVQALYRERYAGEPFVRVARPAAGPARLRDSNECHVYVTVEERGRVLAFSAIDNLWKGASGQGVQNLNLMLGLERPRGCCERSTPSSDRAGSRRPPASRSSTRRGWPPGSGPAPPTAGSRAAAILMSAFSPATRRTSPPRCC